MVFVLSVYPLFEASPMAAHLFPISLYVYTRVGHLNFI